MAPTRQGKYEDVRPHIRPGDSLMFLGESGLFSWAIRTFTGLPTHVAAVARIDDPRGKNRVVLVEALEGKGVVWCYASERIEQYKGRVYLACLDTSIRCNHAGVGEFLQGQIGRDYSMRDAILSAPSQWFRIPGRERKEGLFCSKLDWQAKRYGGGIQEVFMGRDKSPTPRQLAKLPIWSGFVQIKGEPQAL